MNRIATGLIAFMLLLQTTGTAHAKKKKKEVVIPEVTQTNDRFASAPAGRFQFSALLGYALNTYQSDLVSSSQSSIIGKFSIQYPFESWRRWSLGVSGFATLLPLNQTRYTTVTGIRDQVTIRYLGLNLRAHFATDWLPQPWLLSIAGGWYTNTTFVTNNRFGYEWVNGPQLYPQLIYQVDEQRQWGGYLKFSPVFSGPTSMLSWSRNFEAALGIFHSAPWPWWNNRIGLIQLDVAHLQIKPSLAKVYSNTVSMSLGLQF
jgi:hypothetical protein